MKNEINSIGVFCGSALGKNPIYKTTALQLAEIMAKRNIKLVYGGADIGLMKIMADTIMKNNGCVVGVMPHFLADKNIAKNDVSEFIFCETISERKEIIINNSDAYIALPGGFGTFDELGDVLTLYQLNIACKPIGILNVNNFYDNLIKQFDIYVEEGFMRPEHRKNVIIADNAEEMISKMDNFIHTQVDSKWVDNLIHESKKI
ncbi:TIGR00730 family Rossman fold protein [Bacteroidales bacterium OttesenSCG-928-K22]|nr:TIGR00730 family Rossman fold protein [Bacteroidales bacterium OttesenSCG-928-K22]